MAYTANEQKVYANACQEIELKTYLDTMQKKESELLDLLDLFLDGGNHRADVLVTRKTGIVDIFKPKITEAKRQLRNCEKRLTYNASRC